MQGTSAAADPPRRRLVSSAHGALDHVLLCMPTVESRTASFRAIYADLFQQVPVSTRLTVLTGASAADDVLALLSATGRADSATLVIGPDDLDFSIWAQDPFLAVEDDRPCLVQPGRFTRRDDDRIAAALSEAGIRALPSTARFEGGNILVGDDFVLVGRDRSHGIEELAGDRRIVTVGTTHDVPSEIIRPVDEEPDRLEHVHACTTPSQPHVHIDMFLSLAGRSAPGRYRLLVGSPALADEILDRPGHPDALDAVFDDIADQLRRDGFEVIRNPLPYTYADGRRNVDGEVRDVRVWYFASANNCLVQIHPVAGDHVWLPTYGYRGWPELAATDDANRAIWTEAGFDVHQLTNCHPLAQRHGALRCIVKDLERSG